MDATVNSEDIYDVVRALSAFDSEEEAYSAADELLYVCIEWKHLFGERAPKTRAGLLGGLDISFMDAEAHECHSTAYSYHSLVQTISNEGFEPARNLTAKFSIKQMLAAALIAETHNKCRNRHAITETKREFSYLLDGERMYFERESRTSSMRNTMYARRPRADPLSQLIFSICRKNQSITHTELLSELRRYEHGDVIDEIDEVEGLIYYVGKDGKGGMNRPGFGGGLLV